MTLAGILKKFLLARCPGASTTNIDEAQNSPECDAFVVDMDWHAYVAKSRFGTRDDVSFLEVYNMYMNLAIRPFLEIHTTHGLADDAFYANLGAPDSVIAIVIAYAQVGRGPLIVAVAGYSTTNPDKELTGLMRAESMKRAEAKKAEKAKHEGKPAPAVVQPYGWGSDFVLDDSPGNTRQWFLLEPKTNKVHEVFSFDRLMRSGRLLRERLMLTIQSYFLTSAHSQPDRTLLSRVRGRIVWDVGLVGGKRHCPRMYEAPRDPLSPLTARRLFDDVVGMWPESDHRVCQWTAVAAAVDSPLSPYHHHHNGDVPAVRTVLVCVNDGDLILMLGHMLADHYGGQRAREAPDRATPTLVSPSWGERFADDRHHRRQASAFQRPQIFYWNGEVGDKFQVVDINAFVDMLANGRVYVKPVLVAACLAGNDYVPTSIPTDFSQETIEATGIPIKKTCLGGVGPEMIAKHVLALSTTPCFWSLICLLCYADDEEDVLAYRAGVAAFIELIRGVRKACPTLRRPPGATKKKLTPAARAAEKAASMPSNADCEHLLRGVYRALRKWTLSINSMC